jgi:ribosomal-protein-alanine N-acetyltransferase
MTYHLRALTPSDAAAAAALHALTFDDPWSEASFAAQFAGAAAVSLGRFEDGALIAFALFQETAGEADLLTVATLPARRSQGIARTLLAGLISALQQRGTVRLTLDVAEDNAAARHLYARLGFTEDGRRPRYYTAGRPAPVDAILMSKRLAG